MKPQVASFSGQILAVNLPYKRYARAPHREFLRYRSLLVRGRAVTKDFRLERIARLPDGACWKVLSYWRDAE